MDALDSAIIRQLCYGSQGFSWDVRASFSGIARVLEITEDTVRARVRQLEENGMITGWITVVHPGLLGRQAYSIEIPDLAEVDKQEAIRGLGLLDGIYAIFDHYQGGLFLAIFHAPGPALERFTDLVATLCGARAELWPNLLPPTDVVPDAQDWRLIQAMREAPRRPLSELAAASGLSTRSVQRRLARLMDGRAVFPAFKTDFSRIKGLLPVQTRVVYREGAPRGPVVEALLGEANIVFSNVEGPYAVVSYMMDGLGEMDALRTKLEALPGTERVRVDIQRSRVLVDGWIDDEIKSRIEDA